MSQATVRAEFIKDDVAGVRYFQNSRHRHYKIRLWVDGAPEDTYAVTYMLDSTYRDPVREVRDDPQFCLDTTTFGDYDLTVHVRRKRLTEKFQVRLSDALAASYPPEQRTPEVAAAIEEIRRH